MAVQGDGVWHNATSRTGVYFVGGWRVVMEHSSVCEVFLSTWMQKDKGDTRSTIVQSTKTTPTLVEHSGWALGS